MTTSESVTSKTRNLCEISKEDVTVTKGPRVLIYRGFSPNQNGNVAVLLGSLNISIK